MHERLLLEGPAGAGKSEQLLNTAKYVNEIAGQVPYVIDLEDKIEAMQLNRDNPPEIDLQVAMEWSNEDPNDIGLMQATDKVMEKAKPGEWIMVDRIDLAWPRVQRWFTQEKYKQTLAEMMMDKSKQMSKSSMFTPTQDQGSWQVINEQYEEVTHKLLYKSRCNVLMTAGIKGASDDTPGDIGRLGVLPRGQKELGHQPHSVFLLHQRKIGRNYRFLISTDKDLKKRTYFEAEELEDFAWQYIALYYTP